MTFSAPAPQMTSVRARDQVRACVLRVAAPARAGMRAAATAAGLGLMLVASVHGAGVQLGASAETTAFLPSRQNSCYGLSSGPTAAAVGLRSCAQNVTPAPAGLPPEYTATLSAGATAGSNQLPALRGFTEVTRFPRMGAVSAYDIDTYAMSSSRSFLAWNQATPVTQVQFEIAVSGSTLIASPVGVLHNTAGYTLDAIVQRGSVDASNVFTSYYPVNSSSFIGNASVTVTNLVYGRNGAAHSTAAYAAGGYLNAYGYDPATYAIGTGIEIWSGIASAPDLAPTWRSLSSLTSPYNHDLDVRYWQEENPSSAQRFRISLGLDFLNLQFGGVTIPAGSVEGVLFDFSATTLARLSQQATFSFSDDIVFHYGLVRSEFTNTFQVSELRFYSYGVDVTDQAGGAFAASFTEALALAAPVPEPASVAMWLVGLGLLAFRHRQAKPAR